MPKISIIVPVYNAAKYLPQCIDSILNQTFTDFELILVNDGSSDNSEEICLDYKNKDSRIKYISKENGGAASARKVGLENATAEYVGWVDADDWVDIDMFDTLYKSAATQNADIVACGVSQEYANRQNILVPNTDEYQKSVDLLIFSYCNKIIKKNLFDKSDISFPVGTAEYEDVSVTFKLISNTNDILFIPQSFYHYRMGSASVTHSANAEKLIQNRLSVTENNLEYSRKHSVNKHSKILAERMILTAKQNYLDNPQIFNPEKWRSIHPEINCWNLLSFYPFYNRVLFVLALLKLDMLLSAAVKIKDFIRKKMFSKLY